MADFAAVGHWRQVDGVGDVAPASRSSAMLLRMSAIVVCAALASPAFAQDPSTFACDGVFGRDSSEALLIKTYGKENVVTGNVDGPEGTTILATTVFPNDPQKTMEFGWWDETNLTDLSYADLSPSMEGPQGVRVGMSVEDVVAINQAPFTIGGFWWDYGGYASIEDGTLAHVEGNCYISLRFAPTNEDTDDLDVNPVSGEVSIPTSEPLLKDLAVQVQVLSISYEGPEGDE
ncbi:hypothetical protein [Devosia sp. 2618]|uniref:hypothetical protein n=1 Tax=Devosia sp. 2618 TaxID=3156454 RepID=UPI0033910595